MDRIYPLIDHHTVKALWGNQYRVDWDVGSEIVDIDGIDIVSDEFFDAHSDVLPAYVMAPQHYNGDIAWLCVARHVDKSKTEDKFEELLKEHL